MGKGLIFIIAILLFLNPLSPVLAGQEGRGITPYGDFCRYCGEYGTCKRALSDDDAKKALFEYYRKRGLDVEIEKTDGRFIKARVMDNHKHKIVDVIIFDRKTGRMKSIY